MVGLLIVHGIGEQRRGETTDKLIVGLRAAYGDAVQVARDTDGNPNTVTANGQTVRLYEVHWADILSEEKTRGSFTWDIPNTVVWQPMWSRRLGLLPSQEYSAALVWWRVITLVPAAPAGYIACHGARFFAQILDRKRLQAFEERMRTQKLAWAERSRSYADFTAHSPTRVEAILDAVVADVPNYMRSIVDGNGPAFEILNCFHEQMARARQDGCEVVHVLAHSLGTVIAFHALSGLGLPAGQPAPAPRRLFTIGSPLEKIRFFWPWTVRATQPSVHPDFEWVNFHHRADRVSGYLKRFAAFSPVRNVRLKSGGGLLRSHVVYERSPEFLGEITETLFGKSAVPHVGWRGRLKDRVFSWGENILGPLAVFVSFVLGLAFVALTMLIPTLLFSSPFWLAGAETLTRQVREGIAVFTLFGVTIGLLGYIRDRRRDAKQVCERARSAQ